MPAWISDTLCRLATGGGFAVRQLYTDQDEALFDAQRPVILNGIEDIVTRPDLADRAIFLTLQPIDADPVAVAVRAMMATRTVRTETASDLLGALAESAGERVTKAKTWPDSPRALAGRLRRAAPFLRKIGIEISFEREGHARTRSIRIKATDASPPEHAGNFASAPSASSAPALKSNSGNGLTASRLRTVCGRSTDDAEAKAEGAHAKADGSAEYAAATVRANPMKIKIADGADDADAKIPTQSAPGKTATPGWSTRL